MSGKWDNPSVPNSGWECVDVQDLGEPIMTCQMCEREIIRYAHYMQHPAYRYGLTVGCICAGKMEGDMQSAKERDAFMKSRMNKRKNWLERKWKISKNGNQYVKSDGFLVVMKQKDGLWSAFVKSESGDFEKWSSRKNVNENEMKLAAFDCLTKVLAEKRKPLPPPQPLPSPPLPSPPVLQMQAPPSQPQPKIKEAKNDSVNFTSEQNNIFEFIKSGTGHGIIDAVAGAGKTTTIMECAKYVEDKTNVLFCAFNKSIQSEIANKFSKRGLNQVTVKTIHALGFQILKDNNSSSKKFVAQDSKYWTILNKDVEMHREIQAYMEELLRINDYELNEIESYKQFAVRDIIHKFKDRLLDMNQKIRATLTPCDLEKFKNLVEHFNFFTEEEIKKKKFDREIEIYFECGKILLYAGNALAKEALVIDYTDMLYLPFIWNLRASRTYSFLFIDECQNLSKSQLAVVLKYGQREGRILAVGDPYQSIYGFAGADIESFDRIKNTIRANPLPLTTCFRCPPNVVSLAASIRRDISASKQEPGVIEEIAFKQVIKMAKINDLIISRYREPILFLVFEFINKNIQVQIHKDEVNDIIDELKNLFKQEERAAIITEISGGFETIKDTVFNRWLFIIEREAKRLENSSERPVYIKAKTEYLNNRLEFMHKKDLQWKNSCQTVNDMLVKIKDYISATDNCIKLSTIHRAKGLEARRVFILNFNDLPHFKPNQKPWERIQEQNLKYVAITRALEELYLVKSEKIDDIKKEASLFDEFLVDI